jgi:4-aminobutyrate aminotransferase-like enzyme
MLLSSAPNLADADPSQCLARGDFVYRHLNVPVIERSEGAFLYDTCGNRFLDLEAANGTAGLGFNSALALKAFQDASNVTSLPSFCESSIRLRTAGKLAALLRDSTGQSGRVAFDLGGAQGMELAVKIAKCNSSKTQFVVFEGGYHGRSGLSSQFSASHRYRKANGEWRLPVVRLPYPDCEQCRFDQCRTSCTHQCLKYVGDMLTREVHGLVHREDADVAAFIFEPILNAGGIVRPDATYLQETVAMFRSAGALIICDETFTGFYRTGRRFGFEHFEITPDLVVLGKGLTNGIVPLSCVWGREELMNPQQFPPGSHSATFINNTVALSVANTVLTAYEEWTDICTHLKQLETALANLVQNLTHSELGVLSGYALGGVARLLLDGPFAGTITDLVRDTPDAETGISGLILASTGMSPNVIALNPALNIEPSLMFAAERIMRQCLAKVKAGALSTR